ncbi:pyridoxamine 5'-phosphate oxidase family protein [Methyloligella sp. 2.7D]|uniref:pyridoxamine 5'-phosphate oxidase family protein n=1 Tax=unclassified Methyloligella TaxID=2625955 RepID=UPI001ABB8119|nr:pyridoxamine 5'-phosphate oxidase family protein [Methyloligella sp. GL2]
MTKASETSPLTPIHGMTGAKRWAFIKRQRTIRLATANANGNIYLTPLWYVVIGERIFLPLDAGSRHAKNAGAGRSLSGVIDAGDEYATVHGVSLAGTLKPVEDEKLTEEVMQLVFEKYFYEGHPYAENYFLFGRAAGRKVVELVVERMVGWDMRENALPPMPEARVLPDFVKDRRLS